nr:hypothetical protein TetV2_00027 [Oceanusvirus sp.]
MSILLLAAVSAVSLFLSPDTDDGFDEEKAEKFIQTSYDFSSASKGIIDIPSVSRPEPITLNTTPTDFSENTPIPTSFDSRAETNTLTTSLDTTPYTESSQTTDSRAEPNKLTTSPYEELTDDTPIPTSSKNTPIPTSLQTKPIPTSSSLQTKPIPTSSETKTTPTSTSQTKTIPTSSSETKTIPTSSLSQTKPIPSSSSQTKPIPTSSSSQTKPIPKSSYSRVVSSPKESIFSLQRWSEYEPSDADADACFYLKIVALCLIVVSKLTKTKKFAGVKTVLKASVKFAPKKPIDFRKFHEGYTDLLRRFPREAREALRGIGLADDEDFLLQALARYTGKPFDKTKYSITRSSITLEGNPITDMSDMVPFLLRAVDSIQYGALFDSFVSIMSESKYLHFAERARHSLKSGTLYGLPDEDIMRLIENDPQKGRFSKWFTKKIFGAWIQTRTAVAQIEMFRSPDLNQEAAVLLGELLKGNFEKERIEGFVNSFGLSDIDPGSGEITEEKMASVQCSRPDTETKGGRGGAGISGRAGISAGLCVILASAVASSLRL